LPKNFPQTFRHEPRNNPNKKHLEAKVSVSGVISSPQKSARTLLLELLWKKSAMIWVRHTFSFAACQEVNLIEKPCGSSNLSKVIYANATTQNKKANFNAGETTCNP